MNAMLHYVTKSKHHVTKQLVSKSYEVLLNLSTVREKDKTSRHKFLTDNNEKSPHSCISDPEEGGTCCLLYVNDIFHYDHIRSAAPCAENLSNYITNTFLYLDARLLLGASCRNKDPGAQKGSEDIQNSSHTTR